MSGGKACNCSEKSEPLIPATGSNRPGRLWRVVQHRCNHSHFNGRRYTVSAYSSIRCIRCGAVWRTKAPYADMLRHIDPETERDIEAGYPGHAAAMEQRGRTPVR